MTATAPRLTLTPATLDADVLPLPTPAELHAELPLGPLGQQRVLAAREEVRAILEGRDDRLLVIVGPCSIHDPMQALLYAERLAALRAQVQDRLCVVMRVYVDKPRTTVGWRGYLLDPHLDGSFDLPEGLRRTRDLMRRVINLGVPVATELLDPSLPPYLSDLLTWAAIGARTTESQTHRALASALDLPAGFKNSTDGNVGVAVDAVIAARARQVLMTFDTAGRPVARRTPGNPHGHVILRGGHGGPNHTPEHVQRAAATLEGRGLPGALVVDCSHGNSRYDHTRQADVLREVVAQRAAGQAAIKGVMIEGHLHAGKQPLTPPAELAFGVSVTDACAGWDDTVAMLREAHAALS